MALYLAGITAVVLPLAVAAAFDPAWGESLGSFFDGALFDLDEPWLLPASMALIILMAPALLVASRIVEGRGVGLLVSVTGRWRWRWLARTLGPAFAVVALSLAVQSSLAAVLGEAVAPRPDHPGIPVMLLLVVLVVPLQCAAEEYVFRGYLMQLVGGWLRHPAFAILLPVPLFVLGHAYDVWGALGVCFFAIVAGWLCWRTGGIEAAVSMHVANNVLIFALAAFGVVDAESTSGSPWGLIVQTVALVAYAVVVTRWARRDLIARTTAPALLGAGPSAAAQAARSSASMIV